MPRGGQSSICRSQSSPSTKRVLGVEFKLSDLAATFHLSLRTLLKSWSPSSERLTAPYTLSIKHNLLQASTDPGT